MKQLLILFIIINLIAFVCNADVIYNEEFTANGSGSLSFVGWNGAYSGSSSAGIYNFFVWLWHSGNNKNLIYTTEYTLDTNTYQNISFEFELRRDSSYSSTPQVSIAVQTGGNWYVSKTVSVVTSTSFSLKTLSYDPCMANWDTLNFSTLARGSTASSDLSGPITAFGLYSDSQNVGGACVAHYNNFIISGDTDNNHPEFTNDTIIEANTIEGKLYNATIVDDAEDADACDVLTFSKYYGPAWLSVEPNGTLLGTPAPNDIGYNGFIVKVDDGNGGVDYAEMKIEVYILSDIDMTGNVDICDLSEIASQWLQLPSVPSADIAVDNFVNLKDYILMASQWKTCSLPGCPGVSHDLTGLDPYDWSNPAAYPLAYSQPIEQWKQDVLGGIEASFIDPNLDKVDIVFIGDSITRRWKENGASVFSQYYGNPASNYGLLLGVDGDKTGHVLNRIRPKSISFGMLGTGGYGHLDNFAINPRAIVLMIGTNNTFDYSVDAYTQADVQELAEAIESVIEAIAIIRPEATVILCSILPQSGGTWARNDYIVELNAAISQFPSTIDWRIRSRLIYLDLYSHFVDENGDQITSYFADGVHLTTSGYTLWNSLLQPVINNIP